MKKQAGEAGLPVERIERSIYVIRGEKVMLDEDLADLYGVETWNLTRAVSRNESRFPSDFMFRLSEEELTSLKRQSGGSSWGGRRRSRPRAFTQEGVAMLSSVLRSGRAVQMNIQIMRAFVRLRELTVGHREIARKLADLEQVTGRHDKEIQAVVEALRLLLETPVKKKGPIGFK